MLENESTIISMRISDPFKNLPINVLRKFLKNVLKISSRISRILQKHYRKGKISHLCMETLEKVKVNSTKNHLFR
jgi:hypothetical protein